MSALPQGAPRLRAMQLADLPRVLAIEQAVYGFPWTHGNFVDSLAAGHLCELLADADDTLIGYCVAMPGVDEMHLLNLTVATAWQRRGHALHLLDALRYAAYSRLWRPSLAASDFGTGSRRAVTTLLARY